MIRLTVLVLLIVGMMCTARLPQPFCNTRQIYQDGPLSPGEKVLFDMSDAFSGYNLDIKIASNTTTARIVQKFAQLDKKRTTITNLITHHIEYNGNQWGKQSFLLYKDFMGSICFGHGTFKKENSTDIPDIETILVSTEKKVDCFGAALFYDYGMAIVDCMHTNSDGSLQNVFYHLDLINQNVTKKVENQMFIPFEKITRRKLQRFRQPETGYTYLLRAYEANGVGSKHRDNTYMEIFSAKDPSNLELIRVIDRTMLHLTTLAIVDMEVYMGDIFFLDYLHGLFRLGTLKNQQFIVRGRYREDGFSKFAVYSDDLQNQIIIALANSHAVYEINWENYQEPVLINKYSLMEHSHIREVYMNDRFLIVQSSANFTNETQEIQQLDYTWIFNKGARTYMNAYHVVNHNSSQVQLDLNNGNDRVLIADQQGITLYQLSNQWVTLHMEDEKKVGQVEEIVFIAQSSDPFSKKSFPCQQKLTIFFTNSDDMKIWPTGYQTTSLYSSNYPGELQINLRNYGTGSNLSYDLTNQASTHDAPSYWVNKINQTEVIYAGEVKDVIFFHTQVVMSIGQETIIIYSQDGAYKTHITECTHVWEASLCTCKDQATYNHTSAIVAFTTSFSGDLQIVFQYYYFIVFQANRKQVRVYDYVVHLPIFNITYEGLQEAEVTSLASSNGYLYVLRGAVKTIDVYKIKKCVDEEEQNCQPDFQINADLLSAQGIYYFSPQKLITDIEHPQVLFIKCLGSVIIIDVDNKEKVTVLDQIRSNAAQDIFCEVAVNKRRMMIVSRPDLIEIFSLDFLYSSNQVFLLKKLPVYHYEIPVGSDIEFSDAESIVYVNARDPNTNKSVVLIYNTLEPAASGLYGVINLPKYYSRPALEIEVSGYFVDFLCIKTPQKFQIYRVFNNPYLSIKDTFMDFNFTIQIKNPSSVLTSDQVSVQTVNYPDGFTPTDQLNKTLSNYKIKRQGNYTWDDRKWFTGHVLNYNFSCQQCDVRENNTKGKVRVREHVQKMRILPFAANDYVETFDGGLSVSQDLLKFHSNGSIHEFYLLPDQNSQQKCERIATTYSGEIIITACKDISKNLNLYVTTRTSFKAWTWGPFRTPARYARNIQIVGDILAVTNTFQFPQYYRGSVFLYSMGFDIASAEQLDELQIIDENDLLTAHGFDEDQIYIAYSHVTYNPFSKMYKLYLTDINNGVFIVDFTYQLGRRQITIILVQFVDIKVILEANNLHMPTDAIFQAITLVAFKFNPHFDTETILITTDKYHNFQILMVYDDDSHLVNAILHRVYYRYAYYQASNAVRTSFGYVAISYSLPSFYQLATNYTRQVIAVYDTSDYENQAEKGYSERYMLGGFQYNKTTEVIFGFNHTFDPHSNGSRVGLVVTSHYSAGRQMYELSLSKNLTAHLDRDFKNQDLTFIPYNDFEVYSFVIPIENFEQQEEQILAIIITILVIITTICFLGYILFVIQKKKRQDQQNNEQRQSLLTEQQTIRNTIVAPIQSASKGGDSGYEEDDEGSKSSDQNQQQLNEQKKLNQVSDKEPSDSDNSQEQKKEIVSNKQAQQQIKEKADIEENSQQKVESKQSDEAKDVQQQVPENKDELVKQVQGQDADKQQKQE